MTSISLGGNDHGMQIGVNKGSINYFSPAIAVSTDRLLDNEFWHHLSVTIPLEDRKALKRKKGNPAPGTCQWVLRTKELTTWLGSESTVGPESQLAQVLWFYGNPGTGKSIMAIYLTEELWKNFSSTNRKTLAYFFCDSGVDTRKTATSIVKGLLYQLVKQHEKLLAYLVPEYRERGIELFTSFDSLWGIFMAMVADEDTGQKYCIIDALDECDRESQEILLLQLEETFQSRTVSSNVRILVTSRPYPEIRESLQIFPNKDLASFAQRAKDMDLFIEQKVNALTKKKKYTDKVKSQVCRILQDKAEGTFLWIGLACDELKDIPSNRAVRALQNIPKGLNALYKALLEAASKHNDASGDDIQRLLSCVAISSRPLTVPELSEACQLHQEEEDVETRVQFTCDQIESCRLLIIIQDERVLLLHQSVKDYLVGTGSSYFIEICKAHAQMAYRCIDILIDQFHNTNQLKSSFLDYSTQEWPNHARMAESTFSVQFPQVQFFQIDSPCREWWLQLLWSKWHFGTFVATGFSIFHVAANWGICALVDHASKLGVQESHIERTASVVHINCIDDSGKVPLEYAVVSSFPNVVAALLSRGGKTTIQVTKAAAGNEGDGEAVMALLLDRCGDNIIITDEVVKAAAGNWHSGKAVIGLLLDYCRDQITITDEVVKAAAGNWHSGEAVMALLLDRCRDNITITDEVVKAVAGNEINGEAVMALLLDNCEDQITITNEVVEAAAGNGRNGEALIALLLDYCGDQITITDEIVEAAVRNGGTGKAVMALLLDYCGDQITITDEVLKAAAGNGGDAEALMALLLDRCGDNFTITDEVVKAAAGNSHSGKAVIGLLLDYCRDQMTITDEIVEAAVRNGGTGKAVMTLLLDYCGDQITITDEVLKAAAGNGGDGEALIALLLDRCKDQVTITDEVLKSVAGDWANGEAMMAFLLDYCEDQITITNEVVKAAAGNWHRGKAVIGLLLDYCRDQMTITDEIVEAAARNWVTGKAVIALLLDYCGDQITITGEVLKAAAGNLGDGRAVMALLLDRRGDQITITDEVLKAAAGNIGDGGAVMALLLDRCGDQITITDEVLKAAAGNRGIGEAMMALLLDRRGDQVNITGAW